MSEEYWEPWKPKVGQRVAVKIGAECEFLCPNGCDWHRYVDFTVGTIIGDARDDAIQSHCYLKDEQCGMGHGFNLPVEKGHYYWVSPNDSGHPAGAFAAIELELVIDSS